MHESESSLEVTGGSPDAGGLLSKTIKALDLVDPVVRWLFYTAGVILFLWVCFMFADVLMRYAFNRPLPASIDITTMAMSAMAWLGLAFVQIEKQHIAIDLVTSHLKPRAALTLSVAIYVVCVLLLGVLVWQSSSNFLMLFRTGRISHSGLPIYPSALLMPIGFILFFIIFLRDLLSKIYESIKASFGMARWFLMLAIPIIFVVLIMFWIQPGLIPVNGALVGAVGLALVLLLAFLGMPLAFSLLLGAIMTMGHTLGAGAGFSNAGSLIFSNATDYNFSVFPLFILMAYIVVETGLGADAYRGIYKWIGHFKGGLATATIGGSTAMAAVTGIGASTIGIGLIAVPEMRKFKYDDGLAAGAIAAGSTLGPMIPPSIGFIIFGILAQESIGKLFIAGIIPGLLLAISFVVVVMVQCSLNPKLGPPGEKSSWNERIKVLPSLTPIILLFLIIIGGIYIGIFSPMEGGAIGAIMTWVIALFLRRVTWKNFKSAILESMKFICMTLIIIGCGMAFGNSLATTGLSMQIVEATQAAGLSPLVFILIILVIYLIFGIICDAPIILILTTPIVAPALKGMGVDLIWFGVLATLVVNLGTITPPYAMSIFMLRSLAMKDVSLGVMFRGVIPFCISSLVVAVLIIIFPAIATWLPELMK